MQYYERAIWWIKRDFRLGDNRALSEAIRQSRAVLPVFVCEPQVMSSPETSPLHLHAQFTALKALRAALNQIGANVCVATGELPEVFAELYEKYNFTAIYSHQETGSDITYQRDLRVVAWCKENGIVWKEYPQNAVVRGKRIEKLDKRLWNSFMNAKQASTVTTMYWDESLEKVCQNEVPQITKNIAPQFLQPVTEDAALRVLSSFLTNRGETYWGSISSPNTAWFHGSRLSPHLAWGTLSLRQVFQATNARLESSDMLINPRWVHSLGAFSSRLYWHDHFMQKLESFPELEFHPSDTRYARIKYKDDEATLYSWLHGRTGFPMVDATMRCMARTGFVNFRMRAMAISFAAFGLHLSWKKIMYPFARLMADYEPGIHIYQVQMQSGVTKGTSMRVYNPVKQMFDKDIECTFIKKWIPELQSFSPAQIYAYLNAAEKFGIRKHYTLGNYPSPLVHFGRRSREMKEQLIACRGRRNVQSTFQLNLW